MRIAGYAAVFDVADANGDVISAGAFEGVRAPVALLLEHDPFRRIGTVVAAREDGFGLWIEAEVSERGTRLAGTRRGLSIGYRVVDAEAGPPPAPPASGRGGLRGIHPASGTRGGTNRQLRRVVLVEASLVARPMQALARVTRGFSEETGMSELNRRPALAGAVEGGTVRAFVDGYLRQGAAHEVKSVNGASGVDGGYAVPREIDQVIERTLKGLSPIRAIANVVSVGSAGYRKLVAAGGTPSGWAGETAARPETDTPDFHEIAPPMGELYANPAASQAMLDDAAFDLEGWLAEEIAGEFARAEGTAFVTGNGTNRPKGFLTYATSAAGDETRPFGTIQHLNTGAAGAFASGSPQDRLVDLVQSLRSPYRQGAAFVMNAATLAVIRKFKTSDGAFLWQPGLVAGQPDTLLGYPVVEAEAMPDIGANSLSVAFGNFRAGYVIADRAETAILRDPYSAKPFVHFYATKRVGGAVTNSEAIKLLRFAAN